MKHTIQIELPQRIKVSDYHEFNDISDAFNLLGSTNKIRVKEIGFNGAYIGIIYIGSLDDSDNAKMIKAIKRESVAFDKANSSHVTPSKWLGK